MSGDSINIGGAVSGSNIAGQGNTVNNRDVSFDVDSRIGQLIAQARAQAEDLPADTRDRAEFLGELDGLQREIGRDADRGRISGRLDRLKALGESLNVALTVANIAGAVKGWFA